MLNYGKDSVYIYLRSRVGGSLCVGDTVRIEIDIGKNCAAVTLEAQISALAIRDQYYTDLDMQNTDITDFGFILRFGDDVFMFARPSLEYLDEKSTYNGITALTCMVIDWECVIPAIMADDGADEAHTELIPETASVADEEHGGKTVFQRSSDVLEQGILDNTIEWSAKMLIKCSHNIWTRL